MEIVLKADQSDETSDLAPKVGASSPVKPSKSILDLNANLLLLVLVFFAG